MVEHLPENVFECPDNLGLREAGLELLGPAGVPWRDKVAVIGVERVADVDQQLSCELSAMAVEQFEQPVADEHCGKNRGRLKRAAVAAGPKRRDV